MDNDKVGRIWDAVYRQLLTALRASCSFLFVLSCMFQFKSLSCLWSVLPVSRVQQIHNKSKLMESDTMIVSVRTVTGSPARLRTFC